MTSCTSSVVNIHFSSNFHPEQFVFLQLFSHHHNLCPRPISNLENSDLHPTDPRIFSIFPCLSDLFLIIDVFWDLFGSPHATDAVMDQNLTLTQVTARSMLQAN